MLSTPAKLSQSMFVSLLSRDFLPFTDTAASACEENTQISEKMRIRIGIQMRQSYSSQPAVKISIGEEKK